MTRHKTEELIKQGHSFIDKIKVTVTVEMRLNCLEHMISLSDDVLMELD